MTKQERLQGQGLPDDVHICNRLRDLIKMYSYNEVNGTLLGGWHQRSLSMHIDNLDLTYGTDAILAIFKRVFQEAA